MKFIVGDMACCIRESCGSCGADLDPSCNHPWHFEGEDCRAIRKPLNHGDTIEIE